MRDEYLLDTPLMRDFMGQVQSIINSISSMEYTNQACEKD